MDFPFPMTDLCIHTRLLAVVKKEVVEVIALIALSKALRLQGMLYVAGRLRQGRLFRFHHSDDREEKCLQAVGIGTKFFIWRLGNV